MEPQMEEAGRGTDSAAVGGTMAHMTLGEVVIPRAFLDDPDVMEMLQALFEQNGANLAEFTVGDPANKINPETGYPEFGFGSFLKKAFRTAAPLAISYFAPGLGTSIGAGILGSGAVGASTLGNALLGAGIGGLTGGGLKGALTGAITGGIGANMGSLPNSSLQGPTQSGASLANGTGIAGALGRATGLSSQRLPSLGGLIGTSGGGGSSFLSNAANAFSAYNQNEALKKQRQQLLGANQQQLSNLESFDPSGITSDPGYQFNLEQGQQGLNKGLAAGGSLFSGKALKAASEYNQNYANNAFNDYYQRWLQKTQGQNQLYGTAGDIRANATGASAQNIAQSLSNIVGAPVGSAGQLSLEQLRRLGMAV